MFKYQATLELGHTTNHFQIHQYYSPTESGYLERESNLCLTTCAPPIARYFRYLIMRKTKITWFLYRKSLILKDPADCEKAVSERSWRNVSFPRENQRPPVSVEAERRFSIRRGDRLSSSQGSSSTVYNDFQEEMRIGADIPFSAAGTDISISSDSRCRFPKFLGYKFCHTSPS